MVLGTFIIFFIIFVMLGAVIYFVNCYKRCPSDKVIVVNGKGTASGKCVHGGGVYVMPVIQGYDVLSLEPFVAEINLNEVLSKDNVKISTSIKFVFAISSNPKLLQNAAQRLLSLDKETIKSIAKDIILGQTRSAIRKLTASEIESDWYEFLEQVNIQVESDLNKLGLAIMHSSIKEVIVQQ